MGLTADLKTEEKIFSRIWRHSNRNNPKWDTERKKSLTKIWTEYQWAVEHFWMASYMCNWSSQKRAKTAGSRKNIWRDNGQSFAKLEDNYKPTVPRSFLRPKHKRHEENYIKAYHNQIANEKATKAQSIYLTSYSMDRFALGPFTLSIYSYLKEVTDMDWQGTDQKWKQEGKHYLGTKAEALP